MDFLSTLVPNPTIVLFQDGLTDFTSTINMACFGQLCGGGGIRAGFVGNREICFSFVFRRFQSPPNAPVNSALLLHHSVLSGLT